MDEAGDTIAVEDSRIDSNFRPDEVPVTWRGDEPWRGPTGDDEEIQGAEATVSIEADRVVKRRLPRSYRHPTLDERLRRERTREEARLTSDARRRGVPTPLVRDVDVAETTIVFQRVGEADLRDRLTESRVRDVGRHLATIHGAGFVHGDPTTRNVRVGPEKTYCIDFGLGYYTKDVEDYAMDLHVFEQSLAGTADDAETLRDAFEAEYRERGPDGVLGRLRDIEGRGRYQ
jgi:N6-L-threonylcarbamoyladenine synthase/protein kinase Bud32